MGNLQLPELPNIVSIIAKIFEGTSLSHFLEIFEPVVYSVFFIFLILIITILAGQNLKLIPNKIQSLFEIFVQGVDDFVCDLLGPKGKKYVPFLGTILLYILVMNLLGLVPFLKAPTASLSTTLALSICVFFYVQYTAFKELGALGYAYHLMGEPKGGIAYSIVLPVFMFVSHLISELIRPLSLSIRLRSNVWGDDLMIGLFSGFGIFALPLLFFNMLLTVLACVIQAVVFFVLSTIYFKLVMHEEEHKKVVENAINN
jgi:F-type H+-transporting ATPase subunit a